MHATRPHYSSPSTWSLLPHCLRGHRPSLSRSVPLCFAQRKCFLCPRDKSSSRILFISLTAVLHKADACSSSPGCSGVLHFDRTMSPHSHPQPFPGGATSSGVSSKEGWLALAFTIPRGSARTVLSAEQGWVNRGQGWTPWHADPRMCNQVQTTKPLRKCVWGCQGQPEAQLELLS